MEVILFISITLQRASVAALSRTFGRTAMRRWDRLLESYIEEYGPKRSEFAVGGIHRGAAGSVGTVAQGAWPRIGIERIDAETITHYIANC
jgi:hypothetical protein